MGEHNVDQQFDEGKTQTFMKALLEDLRALEYMIETARFETGVARIGAEQEMFLVDRKCETCHKANAPFKHPVNLGDIATFQCVECHRRKK